MIAHRLSTIRNAHRIYLFADGRIVEQGTHDTLMAQEGSKYQEMIKAQTIEGIEDDTSYQDVNRIPDEDDENQSCMSLISSLLFIICCFCFIIVEGTHLLHKDQTTVTDQVRYSFIK